MNSKDNVNAPSPSPRHDWIDVAKGYGILLVMLGHLNPGVLKPYIYSFHVPLFFFLSGYVFNTKRKFTDFFTRKCKGILLPYFSFGLIIIAFQQIHGQLTGEYTFTLQHLTNKLMDLFTQRRCWDLWFISSLFLVDIIFYILVKLLRIDVLILAVSIGLVPIGLNIYKAYDYNLTWNYWNIDVCFFAILFFALGYICKSGFLKYLFELFDNRFLSIIFFVIWTAANILLGTISYQSSGNFLEMYMGTYGIPPIAILAAISGILATCILSKWFVPKPIKYIGTNSLLYYAFHQNITLPIAQDILMAFGYDATSLQAAGSLQVFIGCIIFEMLFMLASLTLISILFNQTKLKFLLGK